MSEPINPMDYALATDGKGHLAPSGRQVVDHGGLDPEDCPHWHSTTMGQDGNSYLYCFDCDTAWPTAVAPVPGPKSAFD